MLDEDFDIFQELLPMLRVFLVTVVASACTATDQDRPKRSEVMKRLI